MMPTTNAEHTPVQTVPEFYDALAPDYDTMTGFQKRFVHERPFFRLLVEKYGIQTALDAGCGTGFHSLLLAQLGVDVTAVDISPAMIRQVRNHARELGLKLHPVQARLGELNKSIGRKCDAVVAMGNTLAHLPKKEELRATLDDFFSVLNPQGILFIQNLNYDRILSSKERVQSIKEIGDKTFVRFYDYEGSELAFNILTIERAEGTVRQTMHSVRLHPLRSSEMENELRSSGFTDIRLFGSIALDDYRPESSKDLVLLARKGGG